MIILLQLNFSVLQFCKSLLFEAADGLCSYFKRSIIYYFKKLSGFLFDNNDGGVSGIVEK
jgi:hypothetical protein